MWVYSRMKIKRITTYRVGIMFDLKGLWTWTKVNRQQDIGIVQSSQYETPASNRLLILNNVLFIFSFFAKHIIVGRFFKNIHPSLQYSSRHPSSRLCMIPPPPPPPTTCPSASLCFHANARVDRADDTILTYLLLVGIVGESGALQLQLSVDLHTTAHTGR